MTITVYNRSNCVQCTTAHRTMDKVSLSYETVGIPLDTQALRQTKSLGYAQTPVVVVGKGHWFSFRPDEIKTLAPAIELIAV